MYRDDLSTSGSFGVFLSYEEVYYQQDVKRGVVINANGGKGWNDLRYFRVIVATAAERQIRRKVF
jgi:hypothetical protein